MIICLNNNNNKIIIKQLCSELIQYITESHCIIILFFIIVDSEMFLKSRTKKQHIILNSVKHFSLWHTHSCWGLLSTIIITQLAPPELRNLGLGPEVHTWLFYHLEIYIIPGPLAGFLLKCDANILLHTWWVDSIISDWFWRVQSSGSFTKSTGILFIGSAALNCQD